VKIQVRNRFKLAQSARFNATGKRAFTDVVTAS
jgi:hypothetical protein